LSSDIVLCSSPHLFEQMPKVLYPTVQVTDCTTMFAHHFLRTPILCLDNTPSLFREHPMFLAHLSTKCSVSFCDPSMSGVRRPCVRPCVRPSTISLNNISSETAYWILTKLHRNDPWLVPYQSCSNRSSWLHK